MGVSHAWTTRPATAARAPTAPPTTERTASLEPDALAAGAPVEPEADGVPDPEADAAEVVDASEDDAPDVEADDPAALVEEAPEPAGRDVEGESALVLGRTSGSTTDATGKARGVLTDVDRGAVLLAALRAVLLGRGEVLLRAGWCAGTGPVSLG